MFLVAAGGVSVLTRFYHDRENAKLHGEGLWRLAYRANFTTRRADEKIQIAIPMDSRFLRIFKQNLNYSDLTPEDTGPALHHSRIDLVASEPGEHSLTASFDFELSRVPRFSTTTTEQASATESDVSRWLRSTRSIQANSAVIENTLAKLRLGVSPSQSLEQQIYQFCRNEIEDDGEAWQNDAESTLEDRMGTELGRAKAMVALCRAGKIAARLVTGFEIKETDALAPVHWVEVLQDKTWVPYDPVREFNGNLPWNWLPVRTDGERIVSHIAGEVIEVEYLLTHLASGGFSSPKESRLSSIFDLKRLPPAVHDVISIILLLPLGALLSAFVQTVIGIRTIGTFSPTLIALSFILADWRTGVVVFTLVILIGLLARSLVDPLRLLMVPRLGFMLTLVVVFLVFTISVLDYLRLTPSPQAVLLPMVILTMTIERLYLSNVEEGSFTAFQLMLGTVFVSFCCYLTLSWKAVGTIILHYPESHFFTLAALVILGRYTGYRLTELYRFRDLAINDQEVAQP